MKKISILGAGTWGAALAKTLASDASSEKQVTLWSALPDEIELLRRTRRHPKLDGMVLPENILYSTDLKEVCLSPDIIVFAVPSVFVRETARKVSPYLHAGQILLDAAKGLEKGTHLTLCEVIEEEINRDGIAVVAFSGPTHAEEVAMGVPTAIVAASENDIAATEIQHTFSCESLRVYRNSDRKGVEICGALKNIIALAAGISDGIGCGDNTKAAIITRGMAEIKRLGLSLGCSESTFSGLAGIGDLVVTCTSRHSRNNRAGFLIGKGYSAEEAVREVGMVVEGLNALPAALALSDACGVELPICEAVDSIICGRLSTSEAMNALMTRALKAE